METEEPRVDRRVYFGCISLAQIQLAIFYVFMFVVRLLRRNFSKELTQDHLE